MTEVTTRDRDELSAGLKSSIMTVFFTKADGTERVMRCTLLEKYLPEKKEGEEPKRVISDNDEVLRVWDLEVGGWRSFRLDSINRIVIG